MSFSQNMLNTNLLKPGPEYTHIYSNGLLVFLLFYKHFNVYETHNSDRSEEFSKKSFHNKRSNLSNFFLVGRLIKSHVYNVYATYK